MTTIDGGGLREMGPETVDDFQYADVSGAVRADFRGQVVGWIFGPTKRRYFCTRPFEHGRTPPVNFVGTGPYDSLDLAKAALLNSARDYFRRRREGAL